MKMSRSMVGLVVAAFLGGCAAHPIPAARVGSAEAAVREARVNGADRMPDAALHVRLAEEQIAHARRAIADGEPERAEWLLVRAEADASLASALSREAQAKVAADATARRVRAAAASTGDDR